MRIVNSLCPSRKTRIHEFPAHLCRTSMIKTDIRKTEQGSKKQKEQLIDIRGYRHTINQKIPQIHSDFFLFFTGLPKQSKAMTESDRRSFREFLSHQNNLHREGPAAGVCRNAETFRKDTDTITQIGTDGCMIESSDRNIRRS